MNLGMRLANIRKQRNLSQKEAARLIGISNVVLNRYEKNERNPDPRMLRHLADFYGVSTDYLLCRTDNPSPPQKTAPIKIVPPGEMASIPVYEIKTGEPMLAREDIVSYNFVPAHEVQDGTYFFVKMKDNSMTGARLQAGDLVLVRSQQSLENGQIGLFIVDDMTTIKRFYRQENLAILKPENIEFQPEVVPLDRLLILGLVVEAKIKIT